MPCYKKSLWLKENGQPLPHTLVLPMVPNPDPYATFPDGIKDEKTPWK